MTHYEVLGLPQGATADEIKRAYRALALRYHPDRNPLPEAQEEFHRITGAYEALMDPVRRASYDRLIELEKIKKSKQEEVREGESSRSGEGAPTSSTEERERKQATGASSRGGPNAASARPSAKAAPKATPKATSKAAPRPPVTEEVEEPLRASFRYTADDYLRLTALLTRGRFAEAERLARRMIAASVEHPIPYAVMGEIARRRSELDYSAEMFAYAVQMDPNNATYQRKYDEVQGVLRQRGRFVSKSLIEAQDPSGPLLLGSVAVFISATYIVFSKERAMASEIATISTWTPGLLGAFALSGLALGGAMRYGGLLDPFVEAFRGGAKSPPSMLISIVAAISFWLSTLLLFGICSSQRVVYLSLVRLSAATAGVVLVLSGAGAAQGSIYAWEVLLWGGNLVFLAMVLGWILADGYLEDSFRVK